MSRFENLFLLPANDELTELWEKKDDISDDSFLLLASIFSESQYGDLTKRPWGMWLPKDKLLPLAALSLVNYFPLYLRAHANERNNSSLINGAAYIILCVGLRLGHEIAATILYHAELLYEDMEEIPDTVNEHRVRPILGTIYDDLAKYCSADYCQKLSYGGNLDMEKINYFHRFIDEKPDAEKDGRFLVMNSNQRECRLKIVPINEYCPLAEDFPEEPLSLDFVKKKLKFAVTVLNARIEDTK